MNSNHQYRDQKYTGSPDQRSVLAANIFQTLNGMGFVFGDRSHSGQELVGSLLIAPRVKILVYTTITGGSRVANKLTESGLICRRTGADAIRVSAVAISPEGRYMPDGEREGRSNYGLQKTGRINRSGYIGGQNGITDRLIQRIREVRSAAIDRGSCRGCGAPRGETRRNGPIKYCSDNCWNRWPE